MCTCKQDLKILLEKHSRCKVRAEKPVFKDPEQARPNTPPPTPEPEPPTPEPIQITEPVSTTEPIQITEPPTPEPEPDQSEDEIELTDISPEELQEQEHEAERIKQELAMLELARLTRKKVRKTK